MRLIGISGRNETDGQTCVDRGGMYRQIDMAMMSARLCIAFALSALLHTSHLALVVGHLAADALDFDNVL